MELLNYILVLLYPNSIHHFRCRHCERIFTVRKTLISHLEKIHKDFEGFKFGSATINTNIVYQGAYNERKYGDLPPPKKNPARKKSTLARYFGDRETIKNAENAGILPCPKCPQVFTRKNILRVHLKMAHESEIKADEEQEAEKVDESKPDLTEEGEVSFSKKSSSGSGKKSELKVRVMKRKRKPIQRFNPDDDDDEDLDIGGKFKSPLGHLAHLQRASC